MNRAGHYFCSCCNDVKFMHFTERYEVCPDCHNHSCVWVPDKKTIVASMTPEQAAQQFQQLKESLK